MRDLLNDLEDGREGYNPMKAAQANMRPKLPKRFYKQVSVGTAEGGHTVLLDGRTARTTKKAVLSLPSQALAEAIAAEFEAQATEIDPMSMPILRVCNPAIDAVSGAMDAVRADIVEYAGTDLLCYRAEGPDGLIAKQNAAWDGVIAGVERTIGGQRFALAQGVMHIEQRAETLSAFADALVPLTRNPFRLAAAHVMTTLTGSALLAHAVLAGQMDADAAWAAAHVDEDWTIEHWGADAEATERRALRWREMAAAAQVARLTE